MISPARGGLRTLALCLALILGAVYLTPTTQATNFPPLSEITGGEYTYEFTGQLVGSNGNVVGESKATLAMSRCECNDLHFWFPADPNGSATRVTFIATMDDDGNIDEYVVGNARDGTDPIHVNAGQNLVALQEGQGGEWVVVQLTVPQ